MTTSGFSSLTTLSFFVFVISSTNFFLSVGMIPKIVNIKSSVFSFTPNIPIESNYFETNLNAIGKGIMGQEKIVWKNYRVCDRFSACQSTWFSVNKFRLPCDRWKFRFIFGIPPMNKWESWRLPNIFYSYEKNFLIISLLKMNNWYDIGSILHSDRLFTQPSVSFGKIKSVLRNINLALGYPNQNNARYYGNNAQYKLQSSVIGFNFLFIESPFITQISNYFSDFIISHKVLVNWFCGIIACVCMFFGMLFLISFGDPSWGDKLLFILPGAVVLICISIALLGFIFG